MSRTGKAAVVGLVAGLMALPGVAVSSTHPRARGSIGYVGTVKGTHAFIGVAVHGRRVTAYVCNSKNISQWFKGTIHGGTATLTSHGGYVLRVTTGDHRSSGSVTFPGPAAATHHFVAARDAKPAGLYRGTKTVGGKQYLGGWIILPDGRQRGEVTSDSAEVASPTLNPDDPTVDIKRKKKPLIIIIAILIG
jgi:hypothetical protein